MQGNWTHKDINGNDKDLAASVGSGSTITDTQEFVFTSESDYSSVTIADTSITSAGIKSFSYIPIETTSTSLDDFKLNGVSFTIQNIIDNTSFDIVANAINNATGTYTIKYLITL